jgi:diguanylate cyclase (GGDEF)-like protein
LTVKNKIRAIEFKRIIIALIIIIIFLALAEKEMQNGIKHHYYNRIKEESFNLANNYSRSLTTVTEAYKIVDKLLDEKLIVASRTVARYEGEYSNELLEEMARNLEIDVIYYFDSHGEVKYSSDGSYIGWKAYEGHPIHSFMLGTDISHVEEIRKDSESELYYKYGYIKSSDGGSVQIGVLADKVQDLLESFQIQSYFNELKKTETAVQISFIDNDFNIIASTNESFLGTNITNQEAIAAALADKEYSSFGNINGKNVYEVYVPVYLEDTKIGTLYVGQPLKEADDIINNVNAAGIIGLTIIFFSILYVMLSAYYKNKQLIRLAYYDTLTDLPNREYLMDFLTEVITNNKKSKKAVLLINCSNFRNINLVSGYSHGDNILKEVSRRLKKLISTCMIFRFTADRFVVYVENYSNQSELISLCQKIGEAFSEPLVDKNYVNIQIGIAEIDNKYEKADEILKDASIALSYIDNYNYNYVIFNKDMEKAIEREDYIEKELRAALSEENSNSIYLEYQPQVDLRTNSIIGFEALARMKTEERGLISPLEFINIAEKKQLIVPLGNLILRTACQFIGKLIEEGHNTIKVAVNISGIQLLREDFIDTVMDIIADSGIQASNLELEITESILVENYEIINEMLKKLRARGITIALDDFGTGYSSFARLNELNIDFIKIDRHFINKVTSCEHNEPITGDIISMSHKIGLSVVSEGVEIESQKEYLVSNNCDIMQGFLFSKPLAEKAALEKLRDNKEL